VARPRPRRRSRPWYLARRVLSVAVLVVLAALAVWRPRGSRPSPVDLPEGVYRVERAVDGDTLLLTNGARVRLQGIDTPETKHPRKPPEPFGHEAAAYTARLVDGREVRLRFGTHRLDRYRRWLAYVYVDDVFLNERLVRLGLARACPQYPYRADMKRRFLAAERQARQDRRGIWSMPEQGSHEDQLHQTE